MKPHALALLLLVACTKAPEPPPRAPVAPAPEAPSPAPTAAPDPVVDAAAPSPDTTAPAPDTTAIAPDPTAPDTAPAPDATAPDTTAIAPDTTAPAPDSTATAPDTAPAPDTTAPDATALAPDAPPAPSGAVAASADAATGLAPEVVARLGTKEPGCVGMSADGRYLLSYAQGPLELELRFADARNSGFDLLSDEAVLPLDAAAAVASEPLASALRRARLEACETVPMPIGGERTMVAARPTPIVIRQESMRELSATIAGNAPARLRTVAGTGIAADAVLWSRHAKRVFVRVRHGEVTPEMFGARTAQSAGLADAAPPALASLSPTALGDAACAPRPLGLAPAPAIELPAFSAAPAKSDCVALSKDGRRAAFKVFADKYGGNDYRSSPAAIAWFGSAGTPDPDLDLSCLVRGCKPDQRAALEARAAELGVTGCAQVGKTLTVDGMAVPFKRADGELRIVTRGHTHTIHRYDATTSWSELGHTRFPQTVWKVVQHPSGGPVFVYYGVKSDDGDEAYAEAAVAVVEEAALGLCAPEPEGTLPLAAAAASTSTKGIPALGTEQLIDGDLTTAWQIEAKTNAGKPAWVSVSLAAPTEVASVDIANGWQRRDGYGDYFALNARVATGTLAFDDGTTVPVTLAPDARGYTHVTFEARTTTTVKLTIDALHDGAEWAKDVSVSELRLRSTP